MAQQDWWRPLSRPRRFHLAPPLLVTLAQATRTRGSRAAERALELYEGAVIPAKAQRCPGKVSRAYIRYTRSGGLLRVVCDIRHDPRYRLSQSYRWRGEPWRHIVAHGNLAALRWPGVTCRTFRFRTISDRSTAISRNRSNTRPRPALHTLPLDGGGLGWGW